MSQETCLICGEFPTYENLFGDDQNILVDGCKIAVSGAYGSKWDLTSLSGYICDACIDDRVSEGRLKVVWIAEF